ncbi:MAG: hypothetical protein AAF616_14745, partial [Bacteroidota bacterium]
KSQSQQVQISFEGVSQSTLIDGTATFIAGRIKQEIKAIFFENFRNDILADGNKIKALFPNTVELWLAFENYDYTSYLNLFRSSFKKDLNNLVYKLPLYLVKTSLITSIELDYINAMLESYRSIEKGNSLASIIANLGEDSDKYFNTQNFQISSKYLAILSNSLLEFDSIEQVWAGKGKFNQVLNNKDSRSIFFGLVYQRIFNLNRKLFENENLDDSFKLFLRKLEAQFRNPKYMYSSIKSLYSFLQPVDETYKLLAQKNSAGYLRRSDVLPIYLSAKEIVRFAVASFGIEYSKTNSSEIDKLLKDIYTLFEATNKFDYPNLIFGAYQFLKKYQVKDDSNQDLLLLLKYGAFMSDLSSAKSAEEVSRAIDAVALPVGSHGIKKRYRYNISFNSFPGVLIGYEWPSNNLEASGNIGFTAPIGIAFSKAITSRKNPNSKRKITSSGRFYTGNSISIFVTLFDIGAPVLYRLNNSTDGFPEEVRISQFVSPGLSFVYGFKNSPFAISSGMQFTPELRTLSNSSESIVRYNLAVTFDLPLFNLYTFQN